MDQGDRSIHWSLPATLTSTTSRPLNELWSYSQQPTQLHHASHTLDPSVIMALEGIRTTPVESSMYARLYECYARSDVTAIACDWDTRAPYISLLEDIGGRHSVR